MTSTLLQSRLLLLALFAASALAMPRPLRVHPVDEDEGAAAEMGDGDDGDDASAEADSSATRPVAILEHRQELQDDGTFNYAFSADNGLTQNEAFHPDGSRTGSYSYVDPKGETILVKYRADRFGFHVLDGSSIPSTPPHMVNTPNAAPSAPRASQQASSDYVSTLPLRLTKAKGPRPAGPRPRPLHLQ
ncbi:Cuticle Protein CPR RR Unclassified 1 [Frankliniella occidentalis]|nr:Cuticle Protein CPR RR Unclassified 1 [Frankliniella occidentalis]